MANSNAYRVYTAEIGQNSIGTTRRISTQPYAGVFFKSQNGSTWSADQTKDLMFKIKRANFDTTASGVVDFTNAAIIARPLSANPFKTTNAQTKVIVKHRNHGMPSGSTVTIAGVASDVGGIAFSQFNANHVISQVEQDQYAITLASQATGTTTGGGTAVTATENKHIDVLYPSMQEVILPETTIAYALRTTSSQSLAGTENTYQKPTSYTSIISNQSYYPDAPQQVASPIK